MYSDDNVLIFFAPLVSTIQETLNRDLQAIGRWLQLISLFLNISKIELCCLEHPRPKALQDRSVFIVSNELLIKRAS